MTGIDDGEDEYQTVGYQTDGHWTLRKERPSENSGDYEFLCLQPSSGIEIGEKFLARITTKDGDVSFRRLMRTGDEFFAKWEPFAGQPVFRAWPEEDWYLFDPLADTKHPTATVPVAASARGAQASIADDTALYREYLEGYSDALAGRPPKQASSKQASPSAAPSQDASPSARRSGRSTPRHDDDYDPFALGKKPALDDDEEPF